MGGRYEEVNSEIEQTIIKVMAEYVGESSVAVEKVGEKVQEDIPSSLAINIEDETMNVEGTQITLDTNENVFKNLENIVDNSVFEEQEATKEEEMTETTIVEPPVIEEQIPILTIEDISLTPETGKKTQIGSMNEHFGKEVC